MDNDERLFGDDSYEKYRENMFDYLYHNKPVSEILKIIDDITRIYWFTLKKEEFATGIIIFIVYLVFSTSTILSLLFLLIKPLKNKFKFLSKNLWVISTLGSVILMSSILTLYGEVTNVKCHLKISFISVGLILSICPSLHTLISNFPERNKISSWFEKKQIYLYFGKYDIYHSVEWNF